MTPVLILGNGISRTAFEASIREYPGEVWACNFAFRDFPEKITILTGHDFALEEAQKAKEENGYKYEIYAGVCAKKRDGWKRFYHPPKYLRDSGSTLVTKALSEGRKVICCGFDFGGADIYSPDHWQQNKTSWVRRWAEIFREFGHENVEFWGYDHKPYIIGVMEGRERPDKYFRLYRGNKPHLLNDAEYVKEHERRYGVFEKKTVEMIWVRMTTGYECPMNRKIADILIGRKDAVEITGPQGDIVERVIEKKPEAPKAECKKRKKAE